MKHRILFLCMGNICRSPAAHCVFQHLVNGAGREDEFEIESAGTIGFHIGEPPDPRMQHSLRLRDYPIIGRSRQLRATDLEHYDLILAMDEENLAGAQSLDREHRFTNKIRLFCEFCSEHEQREVPDPYYGGDRGFEIVLDLIEDGCRGLLENYAK